MKKKVKTSLRNEDPNVIFKKTMKNETSDKKISESFNKTFKFMPLTVVSSSKSYGAQIATSLAKKTASKKKKGNTLSYEIHLINNRGNILNKTILVTSKDFKLIKKISCYKGKKLIGTLDSSNNYSIEIPDNGTYLITIKDNKRKTYKEKIIISDTETVCHDIKIKKTKKNYEAKLIDKGTGIDYKSLEIITINNENIAYSIKKNKVTFSNNNKILIISVSDTLGNTRKLVLDNKQK